ncbi:MAG TPA: hypothetical protein VFG42_05570 [Baekduia sp.]|uniref:hypothetical protein n=1 Tax=Baekduia sp. TaxID=2600305 RepID=UPI002D76B5AB|nr:hypothetical protein [Baekduia sp.]HET6506236.1 hypothetical protein [Baekduia sp.]
MSPALLERGAAAETALGDATIDEILAAVRRMAPDADVRRLAASASRALHGDRVALRDYVARYQALISDLVTAAGVAHPDLVADAGDGSTWPADVEGAASPASRAALQESATGVAFSPWVAAHGLDQGLLLHSVASLRAVLPGARPLVPERGGVPHWDVDAAHVQSFVDGVRRELSAPAGPLETIAEAFALNDTELARLFGVSRQAVTQWRAGKVPANRLAKLTTVASLADLLARKLKPDRLPGVARRAADAYGGLTMLEMIAADRQDELLRLVRASFDPSTTA